MSINPTQAQRAYWYRFLVSVGALVVVYGLAAAEEVAAWLAVGAALLGYGLPAANTPATGEDA